jgi:hypothetical protein
MRAKQFTRKVYEAMGDGDVANAVVAEVIKLIGEGHTEVSPDVITTKVSAALGHPFMLKDLVAANNSSPELQHYIDSINPSKIKFSTDILTVKNQDPVKEKERSEAGVANMAARAASRPRLGESQGISKGAETKFHKKLDALVHDTFGKRKEEMKEGWGRGTDRVTIPDDSTLYWNGNGPLQKEYDALYNELVPSQGKADTIEGEVLRAASKIVYRHYNDGDEFNQASFEQLVPYIGAVTSYDDLAHKATEFAMKANGNYTPNPNWDSLDVMEYGPEEDDYDEEDDDWDDEYEDPNEEDEDEDEEVDEARTTWNSDWYVYNPETLAVKKKFRTYKGAKQYAEANGLKLAASEWYHDKINTQKQTDEGIGSSIKKAVKSVKRGVQGWDKGYTQDNPRDLVKRNKAYSDKEISVLRGDPTISTEVPHSPAALQRKVLDREAKKRGMEEGWESGPEERTTRERDPDAEYDDMRQQKADAEAQAQQAKRPQTKVYTLTGRGPNYEPNYAFPGEYATQDEAAAARAKLMADPSTPNPRDIGISSRTKYLDEGRDTPLRDLEDYNAKKKALQDIQTDPHTSKDADLSTEVIRRLAGLEQQRKDLK